MAPESPSFTDYLAADESPVAVESGTLAEEGSRTAASICLTDRRILFVPEAGGFVDVPREQVRSIWSSPTATATRGELQARLLLACGVLFAALAGGGLLLAGGTTATGLALATIVGAVGTIAVRRTEVALERGHVDAVADGVDDALRSVGADDVALHRRLAARVGGFVDAQPLLLAGAELLLAVGLLGLIALETWVVLALTVGVLAGAALADRGVASVRELAERDARWRRERTVRLHLVEGRSVRFRIDADATIDRELSRLTAENAVEPREEDLSAPREHATESPSPQS